MTDRPRSRNRTLLIRLFAGLAVVIAILAAVYWVAVAPTFRSFPAAAFAAPANQAEAYRQDLAYLRQLPDIDPSFSDEARIAFGTAIDDLSASPRAPTNSTAAPSRWAWPRRWRWPATATPTRSALPAASA